MNPERNKRGSELKKKVPTFVDISTQYWVHVCNSFRFQLHTLQNSCASSSITSVI